MSLIANDKNQDTFEKLREHFFFKFFNDKEWNVLKQSISEVHSNPSDTILAEGEKRENYQGVYYVKSGFVSVSRISVSGRNHYVRILEPGEIFFNPSLFDNGPSPASLKAVDYSHIYYFPRHVLVPIIINNPKATEATFSALSEVIRQSINVIDNLAFKNNSSRLANLLLEVSQNNVIKRHQFSLQFMSNCINTVPEVVSRELRKLSNDGLIEITRNNLIIKNRKGLEDIASS